MRLGVTILRQHLLEDSSDVVELSEAFGQSEALTTRLKHIIGWPLTFGAILSPHFDSFPNCKRQATSTSVKPASITKGMMVIYRSQE